MPFLEYSVFQHFSKPSQLHPRPPIETATIKDNTNLPGVCGERLKCQHLVSGLEDPEFEVGLG